MGALHQETAGFVEYLWKRWNETSKIGDFPTTRMTETFFPNCFAKLAKVNLTTVCLQNKIKSQEKKLKGARIETLAEENEK